MLDHGDEKGKEDGVAEGNHFVLALTLPIPPLPVPQAASPKGLYITCSNYKGEELGVKLSRQKGKEMHFP